MALDLEGFIMKGLNNPGNVYSLTDMFTGISDPYRFARAQIYNKTKINLDVKNQAVTGAELAYLARFYKSNFILPSLAGTVLRDYFEGAFGAFMLFALDFKNFRSGGTYGPYGEGQLHMSPIRPVTAYVDSTSAPVSTWQTNIASAGWTAPFFTIDLNGTNAGALGTKDNVEMFIMGHADFNSSPKLGEVKWKENKQTPLDVVSNTLITRAKDSQAITLYEQMLAIPPREVWTMDANFFASGASEPVLIGVQAVTEAYAQFEIDTQ